jgi:AraC-like DNA-binding protein
MQPVVVRREIHGDASVRVAASTYSTAGAVRPVEDFYPRHAITIVCDGAFECRASRDRTLFSPGSTMLANPGLRCEYTYDRTWGDRVVLFEYDPTVIEDVARGIGRTKTRFHDLRLPPNARLSAIAELALAEPSEASIEELAYILAAEVLAIESDHGPRLDTTHVERKRAIEACRIMANRASEPLSLALLARELDMSPFHFLRSFKRALGMTPHQYLVQTRLRSAVGRLLRTSKPIGEIAFDAGFADLANFNRSFRRALGASPRELRERGRAALRPRDRHALARAMR